MPPQNPRRCFAGAACIYLRADDQAAMLAALAAAGMVDADTGEIIQSGMR